MKVLLVPMAAMAETSGPSSAGFSQNEIWILFER